MQATNPPVMASSTSPAPSTSASVEATPDDRSSAFKAVKGGGETVSGGSLLIAAYAFVWIALFVVILNVFRRQTKVAERLAALEDAIKSQKRDEKSEKPVARAKPKPEAVEGAEE